MPDRKRWCIHMRPSYDITWADAGCRMGALGCALVADDVMRMRLCLSSSDVGCFDQKRQKGAPSCTDAHQLAQHDQQHPDQQHPRRGEDPAVTTAKGADRVVGWNFPYFIKKKKGSKHACGHT